MDMGACVFTYVSVGVCVCNLCGYVQGYMYVFLCVHVMCIVVLFIPKALVSDSTLMINSIKI